ncbi:MAG: hypothetical protein U0414_17220 [Polyangiaceae bacterium]
MTIATELDRGAVLHVRAPKRLQCADCDGGGCARCGNSGAFRVEPRAPLVVPIATDVALPVRIRVGAPEELGDGVDVVIVAISRDGAPSDNAWVVPAPALAPTTLAPAAPLRPKPRPEVTIALVLLAVLFGTMVAISATR